MGIDVNALVEIVINIILVLIAISAVWWSVRSAKAAEHSVGLSAMREFILSEYLERKFKATPAPIINGQKITLLREAKSIAKKAYKPNSKEWKEASRHRYSDSKVDSYSWENRVAFETAWALNHVGVLAYSGMLHLPTLLAVAGDTIIDDWVLCRAWIKSYREDEKTQTISQVPSFNRFNWVMKILRLKHTKCTPKVNYHRRQAEWLALIATLWMKRCWDYPNCECVIEEYGGKECLRRHVQALSHADGDIMPQGVRKDVRSLTGVKVPPRRSHRRLGRLPRQP